MLSEEILLGFAQRYTSKVDSIELLSTSHNTVYEVNCDNPFILRITSIRHRGKNELLSELDFILFLHNNNVPVATPIKAFSGDIITEYISENDILFIVAFTMADGLQWYEKHEKKDNLWRDDTYYLEHIGISLGKIHKASRNYQILNNLPRRKYFEGQHLIRAYDIFEKYSPELYKSYKIFMQDLLLLDKNFENFGLTHGDFLMSNFNIDTDNKVIVYDFDECEYSWFISDIAVFMYYYITGPDPLITESKSHTAIKAILLFMSGYLSENDLPLTELKQLNSFFILRDYILLSTIIEKGEENYSWWDEKLVKAALPRVLEKKAFVDIDVNLIIKQLAGKTIS